MVAMTPTTSRLSSTASTAAPSISPAAEWKPDLFSKKFIPGWLLWVNDQPASIVPSPPPLYVNFEEYAQTFLSKPLYGSCASTQFVLSVKEPRYALDVEPVGPQIPMSKLTNHNYSAHFRNMLIEERRALAEEFKQYNLYETHLEPMPWKEGMYRIMVPGLRDHLPPVLIGDSVRIRAIRAAGYPLTRQFDGYEHGAFIWAIDRRAVRA